MNISKRSLIILASVAMLASGLYFGASKTTGTALTETAVDRVQNHTSVSIQDDVGPQPSQFSLSGPVEETFDSRNIPFHVTGRATNDQGVESVLPSIGFNHPTPLEVESPFGATDEFMEHQVDAQTANRKWIESLGSTKPERESLLVPQWKPETMDFTSPEIVMENTPSIGASFQAGELVLLGQNEVAQVTVVSEEGAPVARGSARVTATGTISGIKFNDVNRDGLRCTLVVGQDPQIIFIIDTSGSTGDIPQNGVAVGDLNNHAGPNTVLDAEISAFSGLANSLVGQGADVALIRFQSSAIVVDTPQFIPLDQDSDSNGQIDIVDRLRSLRDSGGTDFTTALELATSLWSSRNDLAGNCNVIFVSDGEDNERGSELQAAVAQLRAVCDNVRAFGVGDEAAEPDLLDRLLLIDPQAAAFVDPNDLISLFGNPDSNGGSNSSDCEDGIPGVTVYLDLNGNGVRNFGEPFRVTDSNGAFSFTGLAPGTYIIREIVPAGSAPTTPGGGSQSVSVTAGGTTDVDFGNRDCTYSVSPSSVSTIPASGGSRTFTVSTDAGCVWDTLETASWLQFNASGGTGPGSVSVTIQPNTSSATRTTTVRIAGQPRTITQLGVTVGVGTITGLKYQDLNGNGGAAISSSVRILILSMSSTTQGARTTHHPQQ